MAGSLRALAGCLARPITLVALGIGLVAWHPAAGLASAPAPGLASAPAARPVAAQPLSGVNIGGLYQGIPLASAGREIAAAKALHAGVVRVPIPWSLLEPTASGQIDQPALAFTDRLVSAARAAGIRVIMAVDSTPCWASSAPAPLLRRCINGRPDGANAWPPRHPAAYAKFVAYLAQRYGGDLAAIEIWNEPDQANQLYFAGPHKPQRYARILRTAYPAIKLADPGVSVIAGSLVGSNGVFLRALYAAGIQGYYDGLAVHFYTLALGSVRSFRAVQLANGDTKPLWLDEFGWSTCYPRHRIQEEQACVTPSIQGRNLADTFRSLARTSYVAAKVSYNLQDSGREQFGVLTRSARRKPGFRLLSRALASPLGNVSPVTLGLRRRGASIVASGSAPVGDFMQLEAFQGATLRFRAVFTLDRFDRYSITLPSVLGTHGLLVRVYQVWTGAGTAAQRGV